MDAFRRARPEVMEFAKRQEEILSSSPKRKRVEAELAEDSSPVRKRTRAGRRAQQSTQQVVILDSEGDDEDFVPGMLWQFFNRSLLSHNRRKWARADQMPHLSGRISYGSGCSKSC